MSEGGKCPGKQITYDYEREGKEMSVAGTNRQYPITKVRILLDVKERNELA